MNNSMIIYILGSVIKIEGIFMALPCLVALVYGEKTLFAFMGTMVVCLAIGFEPYGLYPVCHQRGYPVFYRCAL